MNIGRKGVVGPEPAALAGDCPEGRGAWEVSERGTKEGPRVGARTGRRPPRTPFLGRRLGAFVIAFSLVATAFIFAASHVMAHDADDDDDGGDNATLTVDDDGAQCPLAYATIQGAVDAAPSSSSATIRVCPGTYTENVKITKGLTLRGDGADKVFLHPDPTPPAPAIIDVSSPGRVVVRGITIDGMSMMNTPDSDGRVFGIRFANTGGEIRNMRILHIRSSNDAILGNGIRVEGGASSPTVKIKNNLVDDFTRVGIIANGPGLDVRVTKNKVIGPDPLTANAPNGIQVSRGATGRVEHNKVSGAVVQGAPLNGVGTGILLFCAGPNVRVKENQVSGSDTGIGLADTIGATVAQNRVENSKFDAYSLQFIGKFFGVFLGCPSNPTPTTNNILRDNRARNSGENGISFANYDPATDMTSPHDNTVSKNDIKGSGIDGVVVCGSTTGPLSAQCDGAGGKPSNNLFTKNRIRNSATVDSTGVDARDKTMGGGTAGTANTWNKNRCNTDAPDGLCRGEEDDDDSYSPGTRGSGKDPDGDGMAISANAPGNLDWHSFGTAENAKDPEDPNNNVVMIDTRDPLIWGAATRDMAATMADLTGHLSVDYYIVAIKMPSPLPGGSFIVIGRGCGGGPPRFELAIDLDGDGKFDGNAIGYIGPPPFTGCAQNTWQHQDLTDDALRWNLLQLGGLPLNTWAQVLTFLAGYPNHKVLDGTMADDSELIPLLGGIAYYDNIEIGDQKLMNGF